MKKKNIILTLRIPPDLFERLNLAVEKSNGRDQSDILREALDLGLDDLALIGYNPMSVAKDLIKGIKESSQHHPLQSIPDIKEQKAK